MFYHFDGQMQTDKPNEFCTLDTQRLRLRAPELTDGEQMAAIRSDAEVNKYLKRQPCLSIAEAEAFILKIQTGLKNNGWFYWALCFKEENKLIGTICLWNVDKEDAQVEVGYELLPAFQGKGIMTEALEKVIGFAFNELRFKKIVAITNRYNRKSLNLLEKSGFINNPDYGDKAGLSEDELSLILKISH